MLHGDAEIDLIIFDAGNPAADSICNDIQLGAPYNHQWCLRKPFVRDNGPHGFMANPLNMFTLGYEDKTPGLAVAGRWGKSRGLDNREDVFLAYGS